VNPHQRSSRRLKIPAPAIFTSGGCVVGALGEAEDRAPSRDTRDETAVARCGLPPSPDLFSFLSGMTYITDVPRPIASRSNRHCTALKNQTMDLA
jgi:hypothetical protein